MKDILLTVRIDLPNGARIGPGKAALLESIGKTGSISAAARNIGMSYRQAWLLIDELDRALKKPAVKAKAGGAARGGATLTKYGREIIRIYRSIEAAARQEGKSSLRKLSSISQ